MEITINETKEDFIQMNIDTIKQLKTIKSMFKVGFIFGIIGIFFSILFLALIFLVGDDIESLKDMIFPVGIVLAISVFLLIFPLFSKLITKGTTHSLVNEGSIKTYLGLNTFRFDDEYIHRENQYRYERVKWNVMEKFIETDTHIFVYDTTLSAFIIPKRDLSTEQIMEVLLFLKTKIETHERL